MASTEQLKGVVTEVLGRASASGAMIAKCVEKVERSSDPVVAIKSVGKAVKLFIGEAVAREIVGRMREVAGV